MSDGKRHDGMQNRGRLIPEKAEKYKISLPEGAGKTRTAAPREGWHNGAKVRRR